MWSKISSALKPRDGNDVDTDRSDAQSSASSPPPDPFCVNATTYYTHQVPPSPPQGGHSRTASREEDIIWSLRTQLALQQELCAQFEIDLRARDELVQALSTRLETSEKENDKRKSVVRSWKKKAAELDKMCRRLEEVVDNSRQESMERSIMDEASGAALRQLHRQIAQLERERNDVEAESNSLERVVKDAEAEIVRLKQRLGSMEATEEEVRALRDQISLLEQEKNQIKAERDTLAQASQEAKAEISNLREELSVTDEAAAEALRQLHSQISELEEEKNGLLCERDALATDREKADAEALALQEQLATTEKTNSEALRKLNGRIVQLEREKNDIDPERNMLAQAVEKAEAEVEMLKEELSITRKASTETQQQLCEEVSRLTHEKEDIQMERSDFSAEISQLRAYIQQLQKDSAAKEVTIVQLNKQLDQDKEDIDGLNIALESKQQELELVKRKHGARDAAGLPPSRTRAISSTVGKSARNPGPPLKVSRTSLTGAEALPPILQRAPCRPANAGPPIANSLRRTSSSSVVPKPKLSGRRVSITSLPSESNEKENTMTPVPMNNPSRRTMVLA